MNKIKFSHDYTKMPFHKENTFEATLLEVFSVDRKELSKEFVDYDTCFEEKDYAGIQSDLTGNTFIPTKTKNYPLPNGKVLVLLLWSYSDTGRQVWTTIRRLTSEKEKYYRSKIGKVFECKINEDLGSV